MGLWVKIRRSVQYSLKLNATDQTQGASLEEVYCSDSPSLFWL